MSSDQKFFDMYSLVVGALALFALGIFVLAMRMGDITQGEFNRQSAEYKAAVAERIAPFGEVYLPGEEQMASAPKVEKAPAVAPAAEQLTGPQVYNQACLACHGAGIGGAPVTGNAEQWSARMDKGLDTLKYNAINGYQGEVGYMPAKGGRADLSDDEVGAAVEYMVEQLP